MTGDVVQIKYALWLLVALFAAGRRLWRSVLSFRVILSK
jgi:hypothetical protein